MFRSSMHRPEQSLSAMELQSHPAQPAGGSHFIMSSEVCVGMFYAIASSIGISTLVQMLPSEAKAR